MRGFTLIELLVVILVGGILAAVVGRNITSPITAFVDTTRRQALVDAGDLAMTRLTRELRLALPNSVRIRDGVALEFLRTRTGGRYRARPASATPSDPLDFTTADTGFDVVAGAAGLAGVCAQASPNCGGGTTSSAACMSDPRLDCLVIYNTGQPADCVAAAGTRTNAYCGDNVAGVVSADAAGARIEFAHDLGRFPLPSPTQRFHVVDTAVSYLCDPATRTLVRYDGYPIGAAQPGVASPPVGGGRVVARDVVACSFGYDPGTATRAALVSVRLTLADGEAPAERVVLYQQAHVANAP